MKIVNKNTSTFEEVTSGGGQQVNDILNCLVGLVIGSFQFAVRGMFGVWFVVEAAVGERAAEALVEEQEQQRYL